MIRSMTGFGGHTASQGEQAQQWEIKSVNGRFLDVKWHLPLQLRSQEAHWEKMVREVAARGRVEISLNINSTAQSSTRMRLDLEAASTMLDQLQALAESRYLPFAPDISRLLGVGCLWEDNQSQDDETLLHELTQGLTYALTDWNASRETEGRRLIEDVMDRIGLLKSWFAEITARAPEVKEEKFQAMQTRIEGLLNKLGLEPDQGRLLQELVVLSDRLDISEEMTRLSAHLDQLVVVLKGDAQAGKRLDFILQECFREINTCGNKAQDSFISRLVIDFKTELEKIREQVQNIE